MVPESTFNEIPCYDTLLERKKAMINFEYKQEDGFAAISFENNLKLLLKDQAITKHMCLTRKEYFEKKNIQKKENQPYFSKIFGEYLAKCPEDAFPFLVLEYFDDFAKFRTKTKSTCASYFTSYNFDSDFMSSLSAIRVNGFSWSNEGFWKMTDSIIQDFENHDGKIITVKHPTTGEDIKLFICCMGFLLDTPERLKCLALMKNECSRCLDASDNLDKTPTDLMGASAFNPTCVHTFKRREHSEMKDIVEKLSELPKIADSKQNRIARKGVKEQTWEEERFKSKQMSTNKRKQLMNQLIVKTFIKSRFVTQIMIDPYRRSVVDFFHLEIQGLFRKHLKLLVQALEYATAMDDLIEISTKYTLPNGKKLELRMDIDTLSGISMLDFIIMSAPIICELIYNNNQKLKIDSSKKGLLYQGWILHLQYFIRLLRGNYTHDDIVYCEKVFTKFQSIFTYCFGKDNCQFPNYHWATHIFEDCVLFGDVTWFWALIFELKHSEFKQFNDRSNNKLLEVRGLQHEVGMNTLFADYPFTRRLVGKTLDVARKSSLKVGMYIQFDRFIGKISQLGDNVVCCDEIFTLGELCYVSLMYKLFIHSVATSVIPLSKINSVCSVIRFPGLIALNQFSFCMNYYQ
ncbi:predicted protein [Naegleria gruberi]|nr:uncharacterized protein NAEGRDRAFT_75925 [Naegleria gruberi]EFC36411.1 predicted protein [Naegleria gruberi]|eukprot:XP_002669155.1 predicted protein [Naegleria gruberi strain NEG-M]